MCGPQTMVVMPENSGTLCICSTLFACKYYMLHHWVAPVECSIDFQPQHVMQLHCNLTTFVQLNHSAEVDGIGTHFS